MNANSRWQEVISENMASSTVPGYKRQDLSFSAVEAGNKGGAITGQHWSMPRASSNINFRQGEMRYTGAPTDVAVEGAGFFEVAMPNGSHAYTRDGEFSINAQGQLVTKQGYAVMGDTGPISVSKSNSGPISIGPDGQVTQGTERLGKLQLVDFNNPNLLTPISSGYFISNNPSLRGESVRSPNVRQGFLETANTSPVNEMANLIGVMRSYESNQKIVQLTDDRMSKAISELGSPS